MRSLVLLCMLSTTALAETTERRLHSDRVEASSFLWDDTNRFVENYHPNYVADDDPATAWVASGSGTSWLRMKVYEGDRTSKVRLRIRNGFRKHARAKDVTVRLTPGTTSRMFTLADKAGWQEVVLDQPAAEVRAVEIEIASAYSTANVAISDVQVFVTSDYEEWPGQQKFVRDQLVKWRAMRFEAAKRLDRSTPLYPGYEIVASAQEIRFADRRSLVEAASVDLGFTEWFDALEIAAGVARNMDELTPVEIAPRSTKRLVSVHGVRVTEFVDLFRYNLSETELRLPLLGTVASLFADELRIRTSTRKLTVEGFEMAEDKQCRDVAWAAHTTSKEKPRLAALVLGRCAEIAGRAGPVKARSVEIIVFDASGKAVLVVGEGHLEAYRWETDDGKPMIAGGRALLAGRDFVVEAKRHDHAGVPSTSSAAATAGRAAMR